MGRRFRAAVTLAGGARIDLPPFESFDRKDQAEQAGTL